MSRRNYTDNAPAATLVANLSASATTFSVSTQTGFPSVPFYATIDRGTASAEVVFVTAKTGTALTVNRNANGKGAFSHTANVFFEHTAVAADLDEPNAHIDASTNIHGVTGAVVGTTNTQTLSNKTLQSPTLVGTIHGAVSGDAGASFVGGVSAQGDVTSQGAVSGQSVTATNGDVVSQTGGVTALKGPVFTNGDVVGCLAPRTFASETERDAFFATNGLRNNVLVSLTSPTSGPPGVYANGPNGWQPAITARSARADVPLAAPYSTPSTNKLQCWDDDGYGHIEGQVSRSSVFSAGVGATVLPAGTLPTNVRPARDVTGGVGASNGGAVFRVQVNADGSLSVVTPSASQGEVHINLTYALK